MPSHEMLYLKANSDIPSGIVTSTARKGDKWFNLTKPGDQLVLRTTPTQSHVSESLGKATVTKVELVPFYEVLQRAKENHTGQRPLPEGKRAFEVLESELNAAYGKSDQHDLFTMVHFIRVNP